MRVTRKELLATGAAVALAAGCGGKAKVPARGVRGQFALDPDLHHFDAFLFAPHPRPVREAIERHRRCG
jgi:hypothetical protein